MTILKELSVIQSTYTNNAGEEKKRWLKIGELHASQDGREYMVLYPHINLAALPRKDGDDRLFVSMFDPRPRDDMTGAAPRNARATNGRSAQPAAADYDDDIAF